MIKYKLNYEDLVERNIHPDFKIVETTDDNIIQHVIDLFNSKIKWDGMFDLEEANNRITNGNKLFVGYFENNIIGYCWMYPINHTEYYLYNLFIQEDSIDRKFGGTDLVYLIIKYYTNGMITSSIDDWNIKSQKVVEKLGFIKFYDNGMCDFAVVILNSKENISFNGCDVYRDDLYDNSLSIFDKLNRIGIELRETEIKKDKEYELIFVIDAKKYNLLEFPKNWFTQFYINNKLNDCDIYSDDVYTGVNMDLSRLSYSLIITKSIPFNFISNFNRFQLEFERITKKSDVKSALYTFCIHQKLKMFSYNLEISKKKLL